MTPASPAPRTSSSSPSSGADAVLIVGVGNRYGGDDAAGLEVIERLRERARAAGIAVGEIEGEPLALLEAWRDARAVVLVDAVRSGAAVGTSHRADAGAAPLPAALGHASSTHAVGVADAIELARTLGRLPGTVIVYGIEGERFAAGRGLTAAVAAAVGPLADRVLAEARALAAQEAARSSATGSAACSGASGTETSERS